MSSPFCCSSMADYQHNIKAPVEYAVVDKRVLVDELGRARDPSTGAIVNIGRRERLPLASEDKYARQVQLKEDFAAECYELREQVEGLRAKLAASEKHASALQDSQAPLLEEISYLRSVTAVIYEKHRIDAYHNLGLGMKNQRLEAEVSGLRANSERFASGLPPIVYKYSGPGEAVHEVEQVYIDDSEKIAALEDSIRAQKQSLEAQQEEIEALRAQLAAQPDVAPAPPPQRSLPAGFEVRFEGFE